MKDQVYDDAYKKNYTPLFHPETVAHNNAREKNMNNVIVIK
jgi:hypothetical protein